MCTIRQGRSRGWADTSEGGARARARAKFHDGCAFGRALARATSCPCCPRGPCAMAAGRKTIHAHYALRQRAVALPDHSLPPPTHPSLPKPPLVPSSNPPHPPPPRTRRPLLPRPHRAPVPPCMARHFARAQTKAAHHPSLTTAASCGRAASPPLCVAATHHGNISVTRERTQNEWWCLLAQASVCMPKSCTACAGCGGLMSSQRTQPK